jgi:hypothetical protein
MYFKILQEVDEGGAEGVDEDDDADHAEGGGVHLRRFRQCFSPPIYADGGLLTFCLCVFDLHRHSLEETLGRGSYI